MNTLLMSVGERHSSRLHHMLMILSTLMVEYSLSLEEPSPEIFLRPRNFNPHPFEVEDQGEARNGPVVFPANTEENFIENRHNFVTARNFQFRKSHPIDNHPYTKVVKKHKYKLNGRFADENKEDSDNAYEALAKHATKVLAYPPEELGKIHVPSRKKKQQGKHYAFSYKVVDHLTGDDFSHSQSRNSKATNGEYRVKLPDGRIQIVSYTADKNGYKADVKYTENEGDAEQRGTPRQDQNVQIQRIPVRELYPRPEEKSVNYHRDAPQPNHNVLVLQAIVPTQIPVHFNDGGVIVSPIPAYLNAVDNGDSQHQQQPRVKIYTTNARDYSIGSYVPSTVAPYVSKTIENYYQRSTISPQISNNGNHGLYIPSTPSSFVVTDQHGQVLDNIKFVSSTTSPLVLGNHVSSTTSAPFVISSGHYDNLLHSTSASPF